jgi:hypothetical protein
MLVQQVIKCKTLVASQHLDVFVQGIPQQSQRHFNVHLDYVDRQDNKIVIIVDIENVHTVTDDDNAYLAIWQQLTQAIYPITIETNGYGNLIDIIDFDVWLASWNKKAEAIVNASEHSTMAADARHRFLQKIQAPQQFIAYSLKDSFWNIMFSDFEEVNPYLKWHIKTIGTLTCEGNLQEVDIDDETSVVQFFADTLLPEPMIALLKENAALYHVHWIKRTASLKIDMTYKQDMLTRKEAVFQLHIDDAFSYVEKVCIDFAPKQTHDETTNDIPPMQPETIPT